MAETTEAAAAADEQAKRADRPSPKERIAWGKAARARVPLEAHADFRPAPSRDPVALLLRQAETRVPELVPIRHGRMLVSPFTFYRGAAIVMADDLATTPTPRAEDTAVRRCPPVEFRRLCFAGTASGLRHQRLRRDPARTV